MRDYLGWRKVFGIATPAINTCVQPEYDAMRPRGVTNQVSRMRGADIPLRTDADFEQVCMDLFASLDDTIEQATYCRPDHLILGISALAVWGGTRASSDALRERLSKRGKGLPVSLATDAIVEALRVYGIKRRIAVVEPYFPIIQPRIESFFAEHGFEVVRFNHMQGPQISEFTRTSSAGLIDALRKVDGTDVEALVQFGANLPMASVADEAERWLGKPVIAVNIATYWHALRHSGIDDRMDGFTRLLAEH